MPHRSMAISKEAWERAVCTAIDRDAMGQLRLYIHAAVEAMVKHLLERDVSFNWLDGSRPDGSKFSMHAICRNVLLDAAAAMSGGVKFVCERLEHKKKAKDSIIMIKNSGSTLCGGIEVACLQGFLTHRAPGSTVSDPVTSYIADVKWFNIPSGAGGSWNAEIKCPVVMKSTRSDPQGNYWDFSRVAPTKLILAPHLTASNKWQVLHVDSDFLTRLYGGVS